MKTSLLFLVAFGISNLPSKTQANWLYVMADVLYQVIKDNKSVLQYFLSYLGSIYDVCTCAMSFY